MRKKCCTPDKPHHVEWPHFEVEVSAGRHWFITSDTIIGFVFDDPAIVTNYSAQVYTKTTIHAAQAMLTASR